MAAVKKTTQVKRSFPCPHGRVRYKRMRLGYYVFLHVADDSLCETLNTFKTRVGDLIPPQGAKYRNRPTLVSFVHFFSVGNNITYNEVWPDAYEALTGKRPETELEKVVSAAEKRAAKQADTLAEAIKAVPLDAKPLAVIDSLIDIDPEG